MPQPPFLDLHFPFCGLDVSRAYDRQPNRPTADGDYARTTPVASNVRAFDATDRMRGGSRPGSSKWCPTQLNSGASLQSLDVITIPNTGDSALMKATRTTKALAVAGGSLATITTAGRTVVDGSFLSATAHVVFAAPINLKLVYTDGASLKTYNAVTGATGSLTASAGSLPTSGGEYPRLVELWRARLCLSGLRGDSQNWFFSAINDETDYDYSPASTTATQAIAGNAGAPAGLVGDEVTGMVPWSDSVLIFGCDHTIYQMTGDPMEGGSIDLLSDRVGMAFGRAWCTGPDGTVYFFAQRGGVYALAPGGKPQPFSSPIWAKLRDVDTSTNIVRMGWDTDLQGFDLFITPLTSTTATTHYFFDARTGGWFETVFANANHNPKCLAVYDGDDPDDRAVLRGTWNGYVLRGDRSATKDDATAIASSVVIGPFLTPQLDDLSFREMQAVLGEDSGTVTWEAFVGTTAELALSSDAVETGTWGAGRSLNTPVRRSGHALWLKLSATTPWALESIRCWVDAQGQVRMRR